VDGETGVSGIDAAQRAEMVSLLASGYVRYLYPSSAVNHAQTVLVNRELATMSRVVRYPLKF